MKKKYIIEQEEFDAIKTAIENVLQLWTHEFIEAKSEDGSATAMSKETFFEGLKAEFEIK